MTTTTTDPVIPRAGMLATVRNRRGVVAAVEPFDGETGRLHLVHLEYTDDHAPAEERLLWELEPSRHLLPPNALPDPAHTGGPMPANDFDALLRAARWTALSPYLDPATATEAPGGEPIASPFHGGVRIESYQLVPLLKALRMPRVNLLIADDVGLGKTVEAGLILTELLLRRRIQRVLVLTPASLRHQWREELWDKFSLRFDVVDRQRTERLRRGLGMDATPWRSFSRIVASYHYLRQPDVLEQFLAASRPRDDSPHLPWDLLIVDECHNLMPSPFGEDSELCRMLRLVAPRFEHRLFLSATPHNGHTRSFTGLLEMLDPVRFSRTSEMGPAMRGRIQDVVIRRLKRDINAGSTSPRFCTRRPPEALLLDPQPREADLSTAFDAFRSAIRALVSK
ncbi:MAG: SNF2-related protein, partial [Acidobacteria bacterium]|nr:SNF2-related protein [Acidobacteriota bacterium]